MPAASKRATIGFNGATAVRPWKAAVRRVATRDSCRLQWGHGGEAVESGDDCDIDPGSMTCFNGATAVRPWKQAVQLRAELRDCFNGATAVRPRKAGRGPPAPRLASMGPRR